MHVLSHASKWSFFFNQFGILIHAHTHTHIHTHAHAHTLTFLLSLTNTQTHTLSSTHSHTHPHMHTDTHTCTHTHTNTPHTNTHNIKSLSFSVLLSPYLSHSSLFVCPHFTYTHAASASSLFILSSPSTFPAEHLNNHACKQRPV